MRLDRLTTKFQQALADAQSLALGNDNRLHRAAAPARGAARPGGRRHRVAARAGRRRRAAAARARSRQAIDRLPKVEGTGGEVSVSRDLDNLLNLTDKEAQKRGDQFIASRAVPARGRRGQGRDRPAAQGAGGSTQGARAGDRGVRGGETSHSPEAEGQREALKKYTIDLTERARAGQARPGHRPRRRDPPHDPDPAAAHQEQPGADRRARRRQDRDRRRPRAAHRQRRGARDAARTSACSRSTWRRCSRARSTAASSRSA